MPAFSIDYDFDEMHLCGDGLMAWGTATLVHDGDGEFYVSSIMIGGKKFTRNGYGSDQFFSNTNKDIFLTIAKALEDDLKVQEAFGEKLAENSDGNPDRAFDTRRDEQMAVL